ncbi:MAG: starvation-sensing protein RspA [Anaerolineae bacterium]|nr:starvation-sensing protein RspA [Anaerolineae bacterium]
MAKPITIKDVKIILTQPAGSRLVIVKVITSEPGLYGLGCATFTQRFHAVVAAIERHLKPFAIGRDVSRIEEFWQMAHVHSYWLNGPVLNNAISGIDQALWDIKGKLANMPVYDLLGGKCREGAAVYRHAGGPTPEAVLESVQKFIDQGVHHIRVQMGGYGGKADSLPKPEGAPDGAYYNPREYARRQLKMIDYVRSHVGDDIELLHDVHERLQPIDAVRFAKDLEPYNLFFLEDLLAPEHINWFRDVRNHCTTRLSMGELFNSPLEWKAVVEEHLIDYIRMHVSQMGGITPARAVALFANIYGVHTAWHGPGDTSPIGHAANVHLDLWAPNFGIQEWCGFPEHVYEMFPGLPELRNGYLYPSDKPGLGIDIDETLAAKYPVTDTIEKWTQTRWPDGTPWTP